MSPQQQPTRARIAFVAGGTLLVWLVVTYSVQAQDTDAALQALQQQLGEQSRRIDLLESSRGSAERDLDEPATRVELQSLSERLSSLEIETAEARAMASDFLESPSTESLRSTTGRLHLDYWGFPQTSAGINQIETGDPLSSVKDRFELRRVRLGVRGSVPPKNVTYQLDLEFAGVDQIGIRDAWIGIDELELFDTVRLGNQKRPYSLAQLNSSNFTVFIERPFIAEAANDPNRRFGIQSYGASDDRRFNWRYGVFNLVPIDEAGFISSNVYQTELAGRLASTAYYDQTSAGDCYLHLAAATSFAFPSDNINDTTARFRSRPEARTVNRWLDTRSMGASQSYQLLGAESVLNLGPLQIGGEYMNLWLQRSEGLPDLHFHGGYLYISFFLTGEHLPWNREMGILGRVDPLLDFVHDSSSRQSGWGAWQFAVRGSWVDLSNSDVLGGQASSVTFALNWYWNSHTRLQFNYLIGDIRDREITNGMTPAEIASGSYQIAGLRFMTDF